MLVKDVMTTALVSIAPSASVAEAARLMLAHQVSGLPVVTPGGTLIGMISEGDLLRRAELGTEISRGKWRESLVGLGKRADEYVHSHARRVQDIMTRHPITISSDAVLEEAVSAMIKHRIKRLPVIADGRLIGILTRSDLLHLLTEEPRTPGQPSPVDEQIRETIEAELARQSWTCRLIGVRVRDGVVDLSGTIFDERQRTAARIAAENTAGVKSVVDHLFLIEPLLGTAVVLTDEAAEPDTLAPPP